MAISASLRHSAFILAARFDEGKKGGREQRPRRRTTPGFRGEPTRSRAAHPGSTVSFNGEPMPGNCCDRELMWSQRRENQRAWSGILIGQV